MYDSELVKEAKKYISDNTNYSRDWINKLSDKQLLAIYFKLINERN